MWGMMSQAFLLSTFFSISSVREQYINAIRSVLSFFLYITPCSRFTKMLRDLQHVFCLSSAKFTASIA